jgi:hypothetical protein
VVSEILERYIGEISIRPTFNQNIECEWWTSQKLDMLVASTASSGLRAVVDAVEILQVLDYLQHSVKVVAIQGLVLLAKRIASRHHELGLIDSKHVEGKIMCVVRLGDD